MATAGSGASDGGRGAAVRVAISQVIRRAFYSNNPGASALRRVTLMETILGCPPGASLLNQLGLLAGDGDPPKNERSHDLLGQIVPDLRYFLRHIALEKTVH